MIRIGVADDEPESRRVVLGHLARYQSENKATFVVHSFEDGRDLVAGYRPDFDILLLDVQMIEMDGFETAHRIREIDSEVIIIFITNMGQLAIKGYQVDALDYLVKPVTYFAFSQAIKRALARSERRPVAPVVLNVNNAQVRLDPSEIVYVESEKHRITVHTLDRQYSYSGTLKALEDELGDRGFFRSNNCYLVNLRHVKRVDQSGSAMLTGEVLQVSRPRRKAFLQALSDHLGGPAT